MTDRVVNSALEYRTQVAFVDGLMKALGLPVESLGSAGGVSFRNFPTRTKSGKDGPDCALRTGGTVDAGRCR